VAGDLGRLESLAGALDGVHVTFLLWPFSDPGTTRVLAPRVGGVLAEHVVRVVYLSAEPAGHDPGSFWALVEPAVQDCAPRWTVLRPSGFPKNTRMWADQISAGGPVRWAYGSAARSLIHERDIADVAVHALTEDGHDGATYVLTGPAALTQVEQVRLIGKALDQSLGWEELDPEQLRPSLVEAFGDAGIADGALDGWGAFVAEPEVVTSTVAELTGAPARSFEDWAREHVNDFR